MNIVTEINQWREIRQSFGNRSIGFVPTMGNLHAGHMSLCKRAREENELAVVSIFVNPAQFNQEADFATYPRTLDQDIALLAPLTIDYIFLPNAADLYSDHFQMRVHETATSMALEGEFRPGHFEGMLTVVLKLLNLINATRAYFGEKDYQQLLLVKKMVQAFFLPVDIVGCPTVRAPDGLALSSRNHRLSPDERQKAILFPALLNAPMGLDEVQSQLSQQGFKVEYIAEQWQRRLGAVWLGETRLIDNVPINK